MNVLTSIERVARRRADQVAIRCAGTTRTYGELLDSAARFAGFLQRQGLQPGERVGLYLHNEPEWIPALLGIWKAGSVAVPFNYLFAPAALRHAATDSGARWVLALAVVVPRLREALTGTALADTIIALTPADDAWAS